MEPIIVWICEALYENAEVATAATVVLMFILSCIHSAGHASKVDDVINRSTALDAATMEHESTKETLQVLNEAQDHWVKSRNQCLLGIGLMIGYVTLAGLVVLFMLSVLEYTERLIILPFLFVTGFVGLLLVIPFMNAVTKATVIGVNIEPRLARERERLLLGATQTGELSLREDDARGDVTLLRGVGAMTLEP